MHQNVVVQVCVCVEALLAVLPPAVSVLAFRVELSFVVISTIETYFGMSIKIRAGLPLVFLSLTLFSKMSLHEFMEFYSLSFLTLVPGQMLESLCLKR